MFLPVSVCLSARMLTMLAYLLKKLIFIKLCTHLGLKSSFGGPKSDDLLFSP